MFNSFKILIFYAFVKYLRLTFMDSSNCSSLTMKVCSQLGAKARSHYKLTSTCTSLYLGGIHIGVPSVFMPINCFGSVQDNIKFSEFLM